MPYGEAEHGVARDNRLRREPLGVRSRGAAVSRSVGTSIRAADAARRVGRHGRGKNRRLPAIGINSASVTHEGARGVSVGSLVQLGAFRKGAV